MKKSDYVFLLAAAAVALAIWYFFIRRGAPAAPSGSSRALPNQSLVVGSGLVEPDASDFAAGHYGIDYTDL